MNKYIEKLRDISKKPVFLKAAVLTGVLAMILILITDLSEKDTKKDSAEAQAQHTDLSYSDVYAEDINERLCDIIASIEGVGKAKIMLTVSSTEEYVYAENFRIGTSQTENSYVIIDNGSRKEALVKKVNNPRICGALIVCEGGDDPRVCEKIYKAVSIALDIPTGKIYVAEMK